MGFLSNLFGKKDGEFTATSEAMSDDQFWKIINLTFQKSKGDFETQQQILHQQLSKLRPVAIMQFDNKFRKLSGEAYTWELWGAIYIINGGCGDDSFADFRGWLIAQGKDFYYRTIHNPETLAEIDRERIDVDWEGMGYVATTVFEEMTDAEMPSVQVENTEITGEQWGRK